MLAIDIPHDDFPVYIDVKAEALLRRRISFQQIPSASWEHANIESFLAEVVRNYELCWLTCLAAESAVRFSIRSEDELRIHKDRIREDIEHKLGVTVHDFVQPHRDWVEQHSAVSLKGTFPLDIELPLFCAKSLLDAVPMGPLMAKILATANDDRAQRLFRAGRALHAFVRRHDPRLDSQIKTAGRLYAEGCLQLQEIADMLGMNLEDVLWELQEAGFVRDKGFLALQPTKRESILAALREQRLVRRSKEQSNEVDIRSVVVATQRLEGVDARCHRIQSTGTLLPTP
ncbi:MAG: hypothetical protein HUU55_00585 [Myxococcales bacterium]|nr:hypothetical protein [Myxococcales bacterium]